MTQRWWHRRVGRGVAVVGTAMALSAAAWSQAAAPAGGRLRGEAPAVEAVERLLAAVGGRERWVAARTLELEYRAWVVEPTAQQIAERAWRDLTEPSQRIELRGTGLERVIVITPTGGWRMRNGAREEVDGERLRRERGFWSRDYYTLFRRLAVADPDLSVVAGQGLRVVVHSDLQGELGWFEIASDGAPVRWGTVHAGEPLEYVYGPLRDYGAVRFPAWGASLDGSWRFEYARVQLHAGAISAALLAPPEGDGDGE